MAFVPESLDSLKYAELQQQCGVKANMKADKLKAALCSKSRISFQLIQTKNRQNLVFPD